MANRALFYKMLRPGTIDSTIAAFVVGSAPADCAEYTELVSSYQKPLCSDAFSLWLKGDPAVRFSPALSFVRYAQLMLFSQPIQGQRPQRRGEGSHLKAYRRNNPGSGSRDCISMP